MSQPTQTQLYIAIAALARSFTLPSVSNNQTGITKGSANQLRIPCSAINAQGINNQQLGALAHISVSLDGDYIEIAHNVGDAS